MDIVKEKFLIQKIAEHKYEERIARGVNGNADHDWEMAEKELANYLLFKKQYSYIEEIFQQYAALVGCIDEDGG